MSLSRRAATPQVGPALGRCPPATCCSPASRPGSRTTHLPRSTILVTHATCGAAGSRCAWRGNLGALIAAAGRRPLPGGSEDRLTQFAHVAGAAISGSRARDALGRMARDQAALRRVAELIARGAPLGEVFDASLVRRPRSWGE